VAVLKWFRKRSGEYYARHKGVRYEVTKAGVRDWRARAGMAKHRTDTMKNAKAWCEGTIEASDD